MNLERMKEEMRAVEQARKLADSELKLRGFLVVPWDMRSAQLHGSGVQQSSLRPWFYETEEKAKAMAGNIRCNIIPLYSVEEPNDDR